MKEERLFKQSGGQTQSLFLLKEHRLSTDAAARCAGGGRGDGVAEQATCEKEGPAWSPRGARPQSRHPAHRARPPQPGVPRDAAAGPGGPIPGKTQAKGAFPAAEKPTARSRPARGPGTGVALGRRAECPLRPFSTRPGASLPQPTFVRLGTGSRDTFTLPFGGTVLTSRVKEPQAHGPPRALTDVARGSSPPRPDLGGSP